MRNPYPKSRLPGPAVRLFDLGVGAERDDDRTVRQGAHEDQTVNAPPEVEWLLTEECSKP